MRIEAEKMWGYFEWLIFQGALLKGLAIIGVLAALGFIICYLVAMRMRGPSEGFYAVTRVIYELFARDLPNTSSRRVYALAKLAFQEAIRRRVLVVMAVFIVILLFGGWFLNPNADNVAKLYISFVMTGTSYLILLLGLFLSCFSLPNDIKNKTVQTIVTKPVRCTEIVLGRVLGFTAVGTVLLALMGVLSYVFVTRGIDHVHETKELASNNTGKTTEDALHQHTFNLAQDEDGNLVGKTDFQKSHHHQIHSSKGADGKLLFEIGEPEGLLAARIPVFGKMRFTARDGQDVEVGLNVGDEDAYVTYVEGNSLMSAIWRFNDVTERAYGDSLTMTLNLKAFRTYKGDIVTGVQGEYFLRNLDKRIESKHQNFIVKEFQLDEIVVDRKIGGTVDGVAKPDLDVFDDIAKDGKVEIVVRCLDAGQYLGMAQADLYLMPGESTFGWNMFKGFFGIWMQMVLIICLGVMFSTFLSGPVAMVATATCLVVGMFGGIAAEIARGEMPGGGPIESIIRMPLQTGAMVDFDLGNAYLEKVIKAIDWGIMNTLALMFEALPAFSSFNTSDFVANGFDVFGGLVGRHLTMTICYFVMTCMVGYFFLKTREMAA